jgi:hypothetical protein
VSGSIWHKLLLIAALAAATSRAALAQGGPPFITDDPGTPGNGHWEINLAATIEKRSDGRIFELPLADINYGLGNHTQLKLEIPWLVLKAPGAATESGLGNALIGVKWRFFGERKRGFSMSMYPQIAFNSPTASVSHGLVPGGKQLLLPIEFARKIGPVDFDGEFGYRLIEHQTDEIFWGVVFGRKITKRLELLGEIHGDAKRNFREPEVLFNLGGRFKLTNHYALLFSSGRSFRPGPGDQPSLVVYSGLRLNF